MHKKIFKIKSLFSSNVFSVGLRILVSFGILLVVFLYSGLDLAKISAVLKSVNVPFLLLAAFFVLFTHVLCILRWNMLLQGAGVYLPFRRIIISFAGGTFFNLFFPSTIGGDILRSLDLANYARRPKEIAATVFLDRLSGCIGLAAVAFFASLIGSRFLLDASIISSLTIIFLALATAIVLLFNEKIFTKINGMLNFYQDKKMFAKFASTLKNLHHEIFIFKRKRKLIYYNLLFSLLIQLQGPLTYYFIGTSLGIQLHPLAYFVFLPIISAISLLPISIGGLGLRDVSVVFFFSKVGVPKELSLSMSLLAFFLLVLFASLGGIIYVASLYYRRI